MKAFLESRDQGERASWRLQQAKEWIDGTSSTKISLWEDLKLAEATRRNRGAMAIQAAYRGWEARQVATDRRACVTAATCIQRHYRGALGRRRATDEYWRQRQVVPTAYSLKLLIQRSRVVQRAGGWVEYLDPDTSAFWYLEEATKYSTWDAPDCFMASMTCVWDPWPTPYSSPLDKPCRLVFKSMVKFQAHRIHAHPWQCPACGNRNSALSFPRCELCDNTCGPDDRDLEKSVEEAVQEILRRMSSECGDHITEGSSQAAFGSKSEVSAATARSTSFPARCEDAEDVQDLSLLCHSTNGKVHGSRKPPTREDVGARVFGSTMRNTIKADATIAVSSSSQERFHSGGKLRVCFNFTKGECTLTTCPHAHPGIRDDARLERLDRNGSRGLFTVTVCPDALAAVLGDGEPCTSGKSCRKYHPYVRPSTTEIIARLYPKRNGERTKVYPSGAVMKGRVVHEVFQGYGVYSWPSGDVFMGQWVNGARHGRGILKGADDTEYVGNWQANVREGFGVLKHPSGDSYEGQFHSGNMHGMGYLASTNGDSFSGQFKDGKPEGIGRFRRKNGDQYNGWIRNGEAHGLGVLAYASGEKYKGDFSADMRCGRGVCSYADGSKFAGYWERNVHQGFGVYVSPGGRERYVGHWQTGKRHGYGRYVFANGDVYDGDFRHDLACGQGLYRYAVTGGRSGDCYLGGWEADRRHGKGVLQWANGSRYEGYWKAGAIDGKGVFNYTGGDRYRGQFKANRKHGRGVYLWANGNSYTGEFWEGAMSGSGEMKYDTGHRYKGQWKEDRKNGSGTFWYADGNIYEGEFRDDEIHGRGRLTMFPGTILEEVYEGDFVKGVKQGRGTYVYAKANGMVYDGEWEDGIRHGKGILRFADGSFYQGDFVREKKHGTGCMVWTDGAQYYGRWVENCRHGEGTLLHADGTIFRGHFRRDKKHGSGTVTSLGGSCYKGEWDQDDALGTKGRYTLLTGSDHEDRVHLRVFGF